MELGTQPDWSDPEKDAVHVAIYKALARENLKAGDRVVFHDDWGPDGSVRRPEDDKEKVIGIVDPFLTEEVKRNTYVWVVMLPGTVTGLRHEWSHPLVAEIEAIDDGGCRGC